MPTTPDYGHRLIIPLIEQKAHTNPTGIYCTLPATLSPSSPQPTVLTWRTLAHSIDKTAWWLDRTLGAPPRGTHPTLAFIGLNGPLYYIVLLACAKVGYKLLLPSTRNSIDAQLHLLDATGCDVLLRGPRSNLVQGILDARGTVRCVTVPVEGLLGGEEEGGEEVERYPYERTWEEGRDEPLVVLHSSGSTGPPKPIVVTNRSMASLDAHHLVEDPAEGVRDVLRASEGSTVFNPMPCFHAAGLMWNLFAAVYFDIHVVYAPMGEPLNAGLVEKALDSDQLRFDWMFLPPSVIEDVALEQRMLPKLEKLRFVCFSGGPLSQDLGDVISKHTPVVNLLGTTENALPPYNFVPLKEWNWILVPPQMKGIEMRAREEDDFAELVIVRDADTDAFHSTFSTFPNDNEYHTKDLFAHHPTEPNMWQHRARSDDVLVLSNGEKVVPIPMEGQLAQCPSVSGVVVLGHGRFETAALVELSDKAQQENTPGENLAAITTFIDKANKAAPAHARLSRDRVLFTSPDKPMTRAGKGTIIRKATLAAYAREIDDLYAGRSSIALSSALPLHVDDPSTASTEAALQDLFANLTDRQLGPDDDFFSAGIDSLQVLNVVRSLKSQLAAEQAPVSPDLVSLSLVYANPSCRKLAAALHAAASDDGTAGLRNAEERAKAMKELYLRYAHDLPHRPRPSDADAPRSDSLTPFNNNNGSSSSSAISVVLTGSTGSLGSYILGALLLSPKISHIYCLNRGDPTSTAKKQHALHLSRGLPTTDLDTRVTHLQSDPNLPRHGLTPTAYADLVAHTRYIIHNAWAVDFNITIDTTRNWPSVNPGTPLVPERPIHDVAVPSAGGYGESKYVGERLLEAAAGVSGVPVAVCRTGQIAGPVGRGRGGGGGGGKWNEREWFPSLVRSSKHLGALPGGLGSMDGADWVPVDVVAGVVVDLVGENLGRLGGGAGKEGGGEAFVQFDHLVNPRVSSYPEVVLPALRRRLGEGEGELFPAVEYAEWLRRLEDEAAKPDADPNKCPGIKLLDFFEGMGEEVKAKEKGPFAGLRLDTKETVKRSETLRNLKPVGADWVDIWCEGWGL
ncbi:thioester reductase domain-containing protein [Diplodia corticola]|uniref:Thioester reductase domain-containing protein n=1 Tax=Diplodia corticola TaxID=236234 RepID=A0A1J9R0I2_9PEZI|nr:thioester reductase domain-containing protein [Diplodia corticola]OJD34105.1 thioester reductase domain-containing protein [Diplodia corticola]